MLFIVAAKDDDVARERRIHAAEAADLGAGAGLHRTVSVALELLLNVINRGALHHHHLALLRQPFLEHRADHFTNLLIRLEIECVNDHRFFSASGIAATPTGFAAAPATVVAA